MLIKERLENNFDMEVAVEQRVNDYYAYIHMVILCLGVSRVNGVIYSCAQTAKG